MRLHTVASGWTFNVKYDARNHELEKKVYVSLWGVLTLIEDSYRVMCLCVYVCECVTTLG